MFKLLKYLLYTVALTAIGYVLLTHWDYYSMAYGLRPRHPDYKLLKPGGLLGHGMGIVGSGMMLLLLLYSLRKRTHLFGKHGAIGRWLDIHIFFGTIGPLMIVLHSTFKLNGIVSVSFWSMLMVALSGFVGRYLYIQIPRTIKGQELSLKETEQKNKLLVTHMHDEYGLEQTEVAKLEAAIAIKNPSRSMWLIVFSMLFADIMRPLRLIAIRRQLKRRLQIPSKKAKQLIALITEKTLADRRINQWKKVHKLFHYWHVFHKPFAVIMYVIMFVHVGITVWLGYTWVF